MSAVSGSMAQVLDVIEELQLALRPFAKAHHAATKEGNLGGAYDCISREDLLRAAEAMKKFDELGIWR